MSKVKKCDTCGKIDDASNKIWCSAKSYLSRTNISLTLDFCSGKCFDEWVVKEEERQKEMAKLPF